MMVMNEDTGALACWSGEHLAERGDMEMGHTRAIQGGKTFIWSLMADVNPLFGSITLTKNGG
jgi:hypothetical protein